MHRLFWTVGVRTLLCLFAVLGVFLTTPAAQQAPLPMPSPKAEMATCREYTAILLNNSMRYEALAQELSQQKMLLMQERDAALAKLKEATEKDDVAPKGTN